jgi:hypothetical protein
LGAIVGIDGYRHVKDLAPFCAAGENSIVTGPRT